MAALYKLYCTINIFEYCDEGRKTIYADDRFGFGSQNHETNDQEQ